MRSMPRRGYQFPQPDRTRYIFVPRQPVDGKQSFGSKLLDGYIENDCLLSPDELHRLSNHKYSAVDTSWLDELCMKDFWERVVTLYPMWLAPNLITLIGLLVNFVTVLTLSFYCPTATETAPSWAYFFAAFGLFVYQTLDATDGKQARRTGSSSPLGELFDHGCDSISQVFVTLNVCYALKLGEFHGVVFFICSASAMLFYCAHWSTYCTGQLRFSRFDVTEAQMSIIGVLILTGIGGPEIWAFKLFGCQARFIVLIGSFFLISYQYMGYLSVISTGGVGRNGSTVAGTSVLFPICPLLAVVLPFFLIYNKSPSAVFNENITLFVLLFGAIISKATNRIIVAHMSRSGLAFWDWSYFAPFLLFLNQYCEILVSEKVVLILCTIYAYASLVVYCFIVTRQICNYMGIYCFRIHH